MTGTAFEPDGRYFIGLLVVDIPKYAKIVLES